LRRAHAAWGAGFIRVWLRRLHPHADLPATRTLQRWCRTAGLNPAPPGRRPVEHAPPASTPHQCWQMDAKELVALGDGTRVSWLRLVDECSGAVLWTAVFPPRPLEPGAAASGASQLARGVPALGAAGGGARGQRYAVGLVGGLAARAGVVADRRGRGGAVEPAPAGATCRAGAPGRGAQDNGKVERSQGTGRRWAEPHACATAAELQRRLFDVDEIQRAEYPSVAGQTRAEAFPQLRHSGRPYSAAWERRHWELATVLEHLSGYVVTRRVDSKGQVSVSNRNHYVGKRYGGQVVHLTFDPLARQWVASADGGQQLRTWPAEEISRDRIMRLPVTHRR
jgi:hypothetical protein